MRPTRPPVAAKASPLAGRADPGSLRLPVAQGFASARSAPGPAPLRVEADVADASVFVDRRFVGKAPVEIRDVSPGPHRVNVSADGFPMHAEEVGSGPSPARSAFASTRSASTSLSPWSTSTGWDPAGGLKASPEGLRFEAASGKDSFRAPFAELARFEVDYLKKTLRVSLSGGRSYNFTVEGPSADPLLVFQQKVEGARKRL